MHWKQILFEFQIFFNRIPKTGSEGTLRLLNEINKVNANIKLKFYWRPLNLTRIYNNEYEEGQTPGKVKKQS